MGDNCESPVLHTSYFYFNVANICNLQSKLVEAVVKYTGPYIYDV